MSRMAFQHPTGRPRVVLCATVAAASLLGACGPAEAPPVAAPPLPQETWTVTVTPTAPDTGATVEVPGAVTPSAPTSSLPPTPGTGGAPTPSVSAHWARPTVTAPTPRAGTSAPAPAAPRAAVTVPAAARERPSRGGVVMPPTGQGTLTGRTVVVDPGHNGVNAPGILNKQVPAGGGRTKICNTTGTGNSRQSEHALTWAVGSALAADLRGRGAIVILTRPDDSGVGPCVNERASIGNRHHADLQISVHADGNDSSRARGFHIIRSTAMSGGAGIASTSADLATRLRDAMSTTGMPRSTYLGGREAITPRTDIAGLNLSTIPAAMVEMGNMTHPTDAALLSSPTFQTRVAHALADAVEGQLTGR